MFFESFGRYSIGDCLDLAIMNVGSLNPIFIILFFGFNVFELDFINFDELAFFFLV